MLGWKSNHDVTPVVRSVRCIRRGTSVFVAIHAQGIGDHGLIDPTMRLGMAISPGKSAVEFVPGGGGILFRAIPRWAFQRTLFPGSFILAAGIVLFDEDKSRACMNDVPHVK